jgi:hypothetical protein
LSLCAFIVTAPSLTGCDQTNAPLVATAETPVNQELFATTSDVGKKLYLRETALRAAVEHALPRLGSGVKNTMLMPLVDIDDDEKMARVTFFRWLERDIPKDGSIRPEGASRWLIVPVNLTTGTILETEQVRDYLEPQDDQYQFVACVIESGRIALEHTPGGRWDFHPSREIKRDGTPGTDKYTRVYAFGVDGTSPDLELVFGPARKGTPPELLAKAVHHDPEGFSSGAIAVLVSSPTVMTVARALAARTPAATRVSTPAGEFEIAADSGEITVVNLSTTPTISESSDPSESSESSEPSDAPASTGGGAAGESSDEETPKEPAKPAEAPTTDARTPTEGSPPDAAGEKPAAEKPAAEKPAAEKPAAEKTAAEKPAAEKPAAEKPAAEKPAAEKPAAEKPAAEKQPDPASGTLPAAPPK